MLTEGFMTLMNTSSLGTNHNRSAKAIKENENAAKLTCINLFSVEQQLAQHVRAGAFTICLQKPKIPVGKSNGTAHSTGKFLEKMEILRGIPLFPFQPK